MTKIKVGVLRGGISDEYNVSLETGGSVLNAIPSHKYTVYDILLTKNNELHINGFPTSIDKLAGVVDVVFNGLHGAYGEDGGIQQDLEQFNIPYTGSSVFSSAMAMNKSLAKERFKNEGIKTPRGVVARESDDIDELALSVFRKISPTYIIKPLSGGSSLGISTANTLDELKLAIHDAFKQSSGVLIEEYIKGREITCGVVDGQGEMDTYALPLVEIIFPSDKKFFDYEIKKEDYIKKTNPTRISPKKSLEIKNIAIQAHKALGLRHYSRADFIVSPRGIYLLEVNSLPGLTEKSLLPESLKSADFEFSEFIDHILILALIEK